MNFIIPMYFYSVEWQLHNLNCNMQTKISKTYEISDQYIGYIRNWCFLKKIERSMKNIIYKNVAEKTRIINHATTKPHTKDKSKLSWRAYTCPRTVQLTFHWKSFFASQLYSRGARNETAQRNEHGGPSSFFFPSFLIAFLFFLPSPLSFPFSFFLFLSHFLYFYRRTC